MRDVMWPRQPALSGAKGLAASPSDAVTSPLPRACSRKDFVAVRCRGLPGEQIGVSRLSLFSPKTVELSLRQLLQAIQQNLRERCTVTKIEFQQLSLNLFDLSRRRLASATAQRRVPL
ncbi:MAG: hypothetical protein ACRD2J_13860 [Thermoanaerobaculia bacterium]